MPYKNLEDHFAAQKRYNQTKKGRAAQHKSNMHPDAVARRKAYRQSPAGKAIFHKSYLKRRELIIQHYGGSCACCGESQIKFLAIDHINGGGNAHRKKLGGGNNFYIWIVKNKFPTNLRVLCHNCNMATRYGATCPHLIR